MVDIDIVLVVCGYQEVEVVVLVTVLGVVLSRYYQAFSDQILVHHNWDMSSPDSIQ
jgi:hypothetical protein